MAARRSDPHKLDVAALADEAGRLDGEIDAHRARTLARDAVAARRRCRCRPCAGRRVASSVRSAAGRRSTWLHLQRARRKAGPYCQRCLQPFSTLIEVDRSFRFVPTESEAEALDADSEDDVLALGPSFDLIELIEDELLLAWPLVPRHERCAQPAHRGRRCSRRESPFAALAALKGRAAKP